MRETWPIAALATLTVSLAAPAWAAPGAPAAADRDVGAVERLEHEWIDGLSDRTTLERILAPDFVHPVATGDVLSKAQHVAWAVAHPHPDRKLRFRRLNVRVYGDVAIGTGLVSNTDLGGGDERRTVFTDVFVRRDGRWRAVSAQETPVSAR